MIPTVPLPSDGADWRCTFVKDGVECNERTRKGLAYIAWEVAKVAAKMDAPNVSFMRALCFKHTVEVSRLARYS